MSRQTFNITAMNLRNVLSRKGSSSIIVVGIAGVVAVVVALLSMAEGIKSALTDASHPDRALVMRTGTQDEVTGWLSTAEVNVLKGIDGIGTVSGELVVVVDLVTTETGISGVAVARGVGASAFEIRPDLKVVAGRSLQPGRNELLVGVNATDTYAGLTLGSTVSFRNQLWDVVGYFDAVGQRMTPKCGLTYRRRARPPSDVAGHRPRHVRCSTAAVMPHSSASASGRNQGCAQISLANGTSTPGSPKPKRASSSHSPT